MWWHGELGGGSNATLVLELGAGAVGKLLGGDNKCVEASIKNINSLLTCIYALGIKTGQLLPS
jgi:hypothetical protein